MKKVVKYSLAPILLVLAIAGLSAKSPLLSAQSVSGSFNPQTQFPVGSSVKIASVYGVAMVPLHPPTNGPIPPFRNQTTEHHHETNSTKPTFRNQTTLHNPRYMNQTYPHPQTNSTWPAWNQTGQRRLAWNQTGQQYSTAYSTAITITAQVTNKTADGGVQWTIQNGSIMVNGVTYTITGGKGGINNIDRLIIGGTAKDSSGHTFMWQLQGLATIYKGAVIIELNGGSSIEVNNVSTWTNLTYIATIS
jgi:hypothetical protein